MFLFGPRYYSRACLEETDEVKDKDTGWLLLTVFFFVHNNYFFSTIIIYILHVYVTNTSNKNRIHYLMLNRT